MTELYRGVMVGQGVVIIIVDVGVWEDEACIICKSVGCRVNKFILEVIKCIVKIVPFLYKGRCWHCSNVILLVGVVVVIVDRDADSSSS